MSIAFTLAPVKVRVANVVLGTFKVERTGAASLYLETLRRFNIDRDILRISLSVHIFQNRGKGFMSPKYTSVGSMLMHSHVLEPNLGCRIWPSLHFCVHPSYKTGSAMFLVQRKPSVQSVDTNSCWSHSHSPRLLRAG